MQLFVHEPHEVSEASDVSGSTTACAGSLPKRRVPHWWATCSSEGKDLAVQNSAPAFLAMANPLYTAPAASVYMVTAWVRSTDGDQPAIMPPSPSKMNFAEPEVAPEVTMKSAALRFETTPLGLNAAPPAPAAKATIS